MKLTCPNCDFENEFEEALTGDARACASCGASLSARRAREYDPYAVGRRVLKVVPAWLLILVAAFVVVLLAFKWASRPAGGARGEDFHNDTANRPPPAQPSPPDSHPTPRPADRAREEAARAPVPSASEGGGGAKSETDSEGKQPEVSEAEEAASFSVQAGAFDDRSQANELVSRLRAAGFDARVAEADESKRFRFQVRSGLFKTRGEAARLSAQLRSKGVAAENVIVEPAVEGQK